MKVDGPVEFYCWEENETFETMSFTIFADMGQVKLSSDDCPYCDYDGHWKEEKW